MQRKDFLLRLGMFVLTGPTLIDTVFAGSSASQSKPTTKGTFATNLIAREGYQTSPFPPSAIIMGRDFWNSLHLEGRSSFPEAINNEPMVKETAIYLHLAGLTGDGSDIKNLTLESLGKNYLAKYSDLPFTFHVNATRPAVLQMREITYDKEFYESWKNEHPNFQGFVSAEWDNHFRQTILLGKAEEILRSNKASEDLINNVKKAFPKPETREDVIPLLAKVHKIIRGYYFNDPDKLIFLRAGWCFDHYAFEWGANAAILETTNTGRYRHQVSLFFVRGASRQYGKKWSWYIAVDEAGYNPETKTNQLFSPKYLKTSYRKTPTPDYGLSPSMTQRDMYLAYLSGATFVSHEGWPDAYYKLKDDNPDVWEHSPFGKNMQEWYEFTQKNPKRGVSYTPAALLVPFEQGYPNWGGNAWSYFKYERPDYMLDAFMHTLVPYPSPASLKQGVEGCLVNSPYGDMFDVIMPNTPTDPVAIDVLNKYKVAFMLGKYPKNKTLVDRLMAYVKEGGTLLLNIKQINEYFPESFLGVEPKGSDVPVTGEVISLRDNTTFTPLEKYEFQQVELKGATLLLMDAEKNILACMNNYGKGHLILTMVDYLVPKETITGDLDELSRGVTSSGIKFPFISHFLDIIVREALPLEVKGDIEYGLNKLDDGWLLYLINNNGVIKYPMTAQEIDPSKKANVEVSLKKIKPKNILELRGGDTIPLNKSSNSFIIEVSSGDIKVIKLTT